LGQLIVITAVFATFWLFWVLPQRKRAQAQRELHSSIEVGDEILTAGGVYGHVRAIPEDDVLLVEIAPRMQVRLARRAIAARVPPSTETPELEPAEGEPDDESRS
jgi:preprotein translocase subunit YajC